MSPLAPLFAAEPFDRSSFSRITFSDQCAEKRWVMTLDQSLQLILAPTNEGPCEARLEFYFPQDIDDRSAITFETRSLKRGTSIELGVQETDNDDTYYSPAYSGLKPTWRRDGARLQRLKDDGPLRQMTALLFSVRPPAHATGDAPNTVYIRNIRLTYDRTAAPGAASAEPVIAAPAVIESPKNVPVPSTPKTPLSAYTQTIFYLALAAALFAAVAMGTQRRRRRLLSPLFELNMRMWKTRKDANDVVQFGGFNNVTLNDLKAIKQAGFNTVWLMGIWEVGAKVRAISKNYGADFQGSPFAIYDYAVSSDLGTEQEFRDLVQRAHSLRLSVIVDFIPNHMGLDSAWLNDHPEYFIHRTLSPAEQQMSDDELVRRNPGYYPYRTPSYPENGRRVPKTILVAYGKDPYFYPWIDTAQLDYANPQLRQKMTDVLSYWAKVVDGVRCDMAMLCIREQVKIHRHPEMSWDAFNQLMPNEFWTESIQAVKRVNPHFVFLAETYWSMEGFLQNLGFDYTYNKPLYEAICHAVQGGHAEGLMNFLRLLGTDFLKRSVLFLENHDEERAMNAIGEEPQRAAAAMMCTLPGIALIHQGQMEGKRERLPVQRVVPQVAEAENTKLADFYRRLLAATSLPVFQDGRFNPLYSNNSALVSYARVDNESKVLVVVNTSGRKQSGSVFTLPGLRLHSGSHYRLTDLFYPLKQHRSEAVQPYYDVAAAKLINQGLYVELEPFDAHIFLLEGKGSLQQTHRALENVRNTVDEWPLNRVVRRMLGAAFTRSSDANLATNPAGPKQ